MKKIIRRLLAEDTIILNDIISLCQLFFICLHKLFTQITYVGEPSLNLYELVVDLKLIHWQNREEHQNLRYDIVDHSFCHIENISSYLDINPISPKADINKYDGLVFIQNRSEPSNTSMNITGNFPASAFWQIIQDKPYMALFLYEANNQFYLDWNS